MVAAVAPSDDPDALAFDDLGAQQPGAVDVRRVIGSAVLITEFAPITSGMTLDEGEKVVGGDGAECAGSRE